MSGEAIPVLLLAGGRSTRMPCPKGLYRPKADGPTWLELQLDGISRIRLRLPHDGSTVTLSPRIILGYRSDEYLEALPWLAERELVINPRPEFGPFSSIQAGGRTVIRAVSAVSARGPGAGPGAFVLPIDVPCPGAPTWQSLLDAAAGLASATVPGFARATVPVYEGRGGHPVWLSLELLMAIESEDPRLPGSRLDHFLRELGPDRLARVTVSDRRAVLNLNTPEEFSLLDS